MITVIPSWLLIVLVVVGQFLFAFVRGFRNAWLNSQAEARLAGLRGVDKRTSRAGGVISAVECDKHGRLTKAIWAWPDGRTGSAEW